MKWKTLHPNGSKTEFDFDGIWVTVYHWSLEHGGLDYTTCASCGCVFEAGGHHRNGCPHADAHRRHCGRCVDNPPTLPAERVV